jgi:hypothetical protein
MKITKIVEEQFQKAKTLIDAKRSTGRQVFPTHILAAFKASVKRRLRLETPDLVEAEFEAFEKEMLVCVGAARWDDYRCIVGAFKDQLKKNLI